MIPLKRIKQTSSIRSWLPWLTAAVLFAIGYPWFIEPILQSAQASSHERYARALYQERMDRLERITALQKKQRDTLLSWTNEHQGLLFSPLQADAFFSSLDQTAASFRCRVVSAEYEVIPLPGDGHREESSPVFLKGAKIHLTGSYDRWIQFLGWLESLPPCVLIDSLKLESEKEQPGVLSGRIDFAVPIAAESVRPEDGVLMSPKEK